MKRVSLLRHSGPILIGLLVLSGLLFASCDSSGPTTTSSKTTAAGGRGCTKVGILLPETTTSARWETKDHPLLLQAVKAAIPDVQIDFNNANGNSVTQVTQAEADLAKGDCILIVGAHDSVAAAAIVDKAKAQGVPVIAYDRLIQSKNLDYYVSFDNARVGQLQGQYIAQHYQQYVQGGKANIVMISGSQTDNNALLYSMGAHSALDPLFANNTLNYLSEVFTPGWNNTTAQTEMETALNDHKNDIQIAYVANDGMADNAISALRTAKMNGKVLVTGQDATVAGIHNILAGDQSMTVYKPIIKEAQSAADLVKALYSGADIGKLTKNATMTTFDGSTIPSILDTPIIVDRNNVASTVIADHFIDKNDVCPGIPAGTAGVC